MCKFAFDGGDTLANQSTVNFKLAFAFAESAAYATAHAV